jgi:replicative DNA helicase
MFLEGRRQVMAAEALPPPIANVEGEAGLLGAMMVANNLVDQIADTVCADDFFEPMHGRIFSAILKEHSFGRAANPVTLKPYFDATRRCARSGAPAIWRS